MDNVKEASIYVYDAGCVTLDGDFYMWGRSYGDTPVKISNNVSHIVINNSNRAYITQDNEIYAWGSNSSGQLGNGTNEDTTNHTKVIIPSNFDNESTPVLSFGNVNGVVGNSSWLLETILHNLLLN